MHKFRVITITAAVAALATAGVATAASKPIVFKKGAALPKGDKIVDRKVTLSKGQKVSVTMTAPKGMTLQALAHSGKITWKAPKALKGKKSVKLSVTTAKGASGTIKGTIYALVH